MPRIMAQERCRLCCCKFLTLEGLVVAASILGVTYRIQKVALTRYSSHANTYTPQVLWMSISKSLLRMRIRWNGDNGRVLGWVRRHEPNVCTCFSYLLRQRREKKILGFELCSLDSPVACTHHNHEILWQKKLVFLNTITLSKTERSGISKNIR